MPACDLYQSAWFKKARRYAEQRGDAYFILSAKHGLLRPDAVIDPYERTLVDMTRRERIYWANWVLLELALASEPCHVVVLAGRLYREFVVDGLLRGGYTVEVPMEGLGIGQQLRWLDEHVHEQSEQLNLF